jgi:membrane-bound serine protease (ClpP class)
MVNFISTKLLTLRYIILTGFLLFHTFTLLASTNSDTVLVMEIRDVIDPRMNRYVELALEEAKNVGAKLVVIDMDTPGGALNDADDISTAILEFPLPIHVFINKDAASAGALISIACDSIYMASGSRIGAATVVTADGTAAPDKYQSYMRSIMRSTAEANGRDPKIAEAMVDEELEIPGISEKGEVLTFSTKEALNNGFCEAEVNDIEDIVARQNLDDYTIYRYQKDSVEKVIAFFLNPFISGILILVIVGGIYFELQTPGVGFPILAAIVAGILYLVPYYLNGLAANWEILVFLVGLLLIAIEVFVIPGFGLAGISGLILTIGGLSLVMINNDAFDFSFVPAGEIMTAILTTLIGLLGAVILMIFGGVGFTESKFFRRVALVDVQDSKEGFTSNFKTRSYLGELGTAFTVLRPSGKVKIGDEVLDAYTRGEFIAEGEQIKVIDEEGTSLKVKKL